MASIHMEIETCEGVLTFIRETHRVMKEALHNASSRVNGTVGSDWIANSATLFLTEFQTLEKRLGGHLEQLEEFETRLGEAIEAMKSASDRLG